MRSAICRSPTTARAASAGASGASRPWPRAPCWPSAGRARPRPCPSSGRRRRGDPEAVALRDLLADRLARALLLLALTFDPAALVIGGGVADAGEPLVAAVRDALAALVRRSRFLAALGIPGRLTGSPGELVGALGAVEVARSGPRAMARAAR